MMCSHGNSYYAFCDFDWSAALQASNRIFLHMHRNMICYSLGLLPFSKSKLTTSCITRFVSACCFSCSLSIVQVSCITANQKYNTYLHIPWERPRGYQSLARSTVHRCSPRIETFSRKDSYSFLFRMVLPMRMRR